jgi:hypothetical protein
MRVFAIGIEHALDAPIERPHDANARISESRTSSGHLSALKVVHWLQR